VPSASGVQAEDAARNEVPAAELLPAEAAAGNEKSACHGFNNLCNTTSSRVRDGIGWALGDTGEDATMDVFAEPADGSVTVSTPQNGIVIRHQSSPVPDLAQNISLRHTCMGQQKHQ
jgi:hypothetical protein